MQSGRFLVPVTAGMPAFDTLINANGFTGRTHDCSWKFEDNMFDINKYNFPPSIQLRRLFPSTS